MPSPPYHHVLNDQLLGAEALAKEAHVRRSSWERRRIRYQLAALLRVRLLHLVLQRFGPERPDADDAQDDQR